MKNIKRLSSLVMAARGEAPADILIKNANVVNVFSGEVYKTDVALLGDVIAGAGNFYTKAARVVDIEGKYLLPGLIDAHIHIESTMLCPWEFSRLALPRGTTAVIADPHEITNVLGMRGFDYMLKASEGLPLDFFFMAPPCVPATDLETAGARFTVADIEKCLEKPRVLGLAEMMNFPGVINRDSGALGKIAAALNHRIPMDGHSPGLSGALLQAYLAAGPDTDHECSTLPEAMEKLRAGMKIMIREGTVEKNLDDLLPLINADNIGRICIVSDDKNPLELFTLGHLDHALRKAVRFGISPARAVRMVTANPAAFYNLGRRGAIAPGYLADLVVVDDLSDFKVDKVFKSGRMVVDAGELAVRLPKRHDPAVTARVRMRPLSEGSFTIPDRGKEVHVIEIAPGQIITKRFTARLGAKDGALTPDTERDILKLAVVERHKRTGAMGLGFVRGFGIKRGAIASSVAHDSHNIVVAGADDVSMLTAVRELEKIGGGFAAATGKRITGRVPLPVAGLMSGEPAEKVIARLVRLIEKTGEMGASLENPFFALSFLALPVVPSLKLTDRGLVDVERMAVIPLYAD